MTNQLVKMSRKEVDRLAVIQQVQRALNFVAIFVVVYPMMKLLLDNLIPQDTIKGIFSFVLHITSYILLYYANKMVIENTSIHKPEPYHYQRNSAGNSTVLFKHASKSDATVAVAKKSCDIIIRF